MGLFDFLKKKEFEQINQLKGQLEKYKSITDIEIEVARQSKILDDLIYAKNAEVNNIEINFSKLNSDYQVALETYTKLRKEVSVFESKLDLIEFGIYEPVYDFEKSDEYREEQNRIIELQKAMISGDTAAICNTKWTVGDSEAKGRTVVNRYKKLMLRAFNGECDVLIAKLKYYGLKTHRLNTLTESHLSVG